MFGTGYTIRLIVEIWSPPGQLVITLINEPKVKLGSYLRWILKSYKVELPNRNAMNGPLEAIVLNWFSINKHKEKRH